MVSISFLIHKFRYVMQNVLPQEDPQYNNPYYIIIIILSS